MTSSLPEDSGELAGVCHIGSDNCNEHGKEFSPDFNCGHGPQECNYSGFQASDLKFRA